MLDSSDHMSALGVRSLRSGGKKLMPEIKEKDDTTDESIEMVMQDYRNKQGGLKPSVSNKNFRRSFGQWSGVESSPGRLLKKTGADREI